MANIIAIHAKFYLKMFKILLDVREILFSSVIRTQLVAKSVPVLSSDKMCKNRKSQKWFSLLLQ